ncbi:MAG: hypothetical protein WC840_05170 [Candidatus Peribacteraceae bacterium]
MLGFHEPKQAAVPPADTGATPPRPPRVLLPALGRLGVPLCVFGAVFLLATVLLTVLLTPDRFPVRLGDRIVRIRDLESEEKALVSRQAELLSAREKLGSESRSPVLHEVMKLKKDILPVGPALLSIDDVRRSFASRDADPISLPQVEVRGEEGKILLSGEARSDSGRSIQLLARFVDSLRASPLFQSVSEPEYKQVNAPDGTTVSPFSLTITLKRA